MDFANKSRKYPFQEIPHAYCSDLERINDKYVSKLYSYFIFSYFDYDGKENDEIDANILEFLKQYKLIVYKINNISHQNNIKSILVNAVICVEKQCIIIKLVNIQKLQSIFQQTGSSLINISSKNSYESKEKEDTLALEEVNSFRNSFMKELKNNFFVNNTIDPLISFIIRRHFYPTSYFNDKSFFVYNQQITKLQTEDIFSISLFENQKKKNQNQIEKFNEDDFIKLRAIKSSNSSTFYLVFHLKSFYIFAMKLSNVNEKTFDHESDFCKNYSHILMTHFYGFATSDDENIKGFVYEFMSNSSLTNFMNSKQIDEIFRIKTLFCVFQVLSYLHSNNLIHRDIKPCNILIDHNGIPHLSDYDQVRKVEINQETPMTQSIGTETFASPEQLNGNEKISFPTDIYSFGKVIYYLYENKTISNFDILQMSNGSKEIHYLYEKCCQYNPNKRLKIEDIRSIIYLLVGKILYEQKNYKNSFEFFLESSKQNNSESFYYLGEQYKNGKGVEKDHIKAKYYFELSIKQDNNANAQFEYGLLYFNGDGVKKDYSKAKYYFELSSKQNNSDSLYFIGKMYDNGYCVKKDIQEALKYYQKSADMKNVKAINCMGFLYYLGRGVPKDYKKCKHYIELAVNLGDDLATNNLGYLYYEGIGVQRDYSLAKHYFEIAAKQYKLPIAYYNLAKMYFYGNDIKIDYCIARDYFQLAADGGHSDANIFLGKIYQKGLKCTTNYEEAIKRYEISAQDNNSDALFILGKIYYKGKIVKNDYVKAKEYFEKAFQNDNIDALFYLAKMYYYGKGVDQNYIKARYYFELCSSKNILPAYFYTGLMHEKGEGVEKRNLKKSIHYYSECAKNPDQNVIFEYDEGNSVYSKKVINKFYYRSNNDLSLIYFTEPEFIDIKKGLEYLKNAALNEYPYGQYIYGSYLLYYEKQFENARYMLEKASRNKFFLAEFNLGYICEQEKKFDECILHYLKAIEYQNEPFIFNKQLIEDERLEISKTLIISFANLKLASIYLNQGKNEESIKEFIFNALFTPSIKLLIHSKSKSYCFTIKEYKNFIQEFILNFPLYQLSNKINPDDLLWNENTKSDSISIIIQDQNQSNYNNQKKNEKYKCNFDFKKCDKNTFTNDIEKIINKLNLETQFTISKNERSNEIKLNNTNDNIERILVISNNLIEILFTNEIKNQIEETIEKLSQILFTEPFSIIFGRINIYKSIQKIKPQDLNKSFYEGFENE